MRLAGFDTQPGVDHRCGVAWHQIRLRTLASSGRSLWRFYRHRLGLRINPRHGKSLVDRNPLDERRVITQDFDGGVTQPLIVFEMAADKSPLRTELARPPSGHTATDAEGLGFVRSGKHNPASHGNRRATQRS